MNKNDRIKLKITALSSEGHGIGRSEDNTAVFVPQSAVGDEVEVIIVKVLKNYCFGKIIDIIKESPDRVEPDCDVFSRCGGCCYRHISYSAQLEAKNKRVTDAVTRIGKISAPILPIIGDERTSRYRNKAQYPIGADENGKAVCGFYALHSHRIIPCDDCKLQPKPFSDIVKTVISFINSNRIPVYNEQNHSGIARHIYLRETNNGEIMVCLVINADRLPKEMEKQLVSLLQQNEAVKSVVLNINKKQTGVILGNKCRVLFGANALEDELLGIKVRISPLSFYQVNHDMTEKLYSVAAEFAAPEGKTVLDLYCGAGTIGLTMAKRAKQIIGVEIVESAVRDAEKNAEINGIENARFICGNAADCAKKLAAEKIAPDVVILDPPRKGAESTLIDTIANEFSPKTVVYVSCDPATLARDLAIFAEKGYKTEKIQPVDMFPSTAHVESVARLTKDE